jgi:hypothetical protein
MDKTLRHKTQITHPCDEQGKDDNWKKVNYKYSPFVEIVDKAESQQQQLPTVQISLNIPEDSSPTHMEITSNGKTNP